MMTQRAVQTREETLLHHRERLNAVLLHIQENLDASLTTETLAAVAGFSPFYFHRVFAAYLRETASDYVRRIRLEWAARRLIFDSEPVTRIALAAGYETPAAFGRAFKSRFGVSPRSFRAERRPLRFANNWEPLLLQPEFRRRPDHALAYVPCVGAEAESESAWRLLQGCPGIAAAPQEPLAYVQVCRDRPNDGITARARMRVDVGVLLDESASLQPSGRVGVQRLAGGLYAVFEHCGGRREAMWQAIYKRWLPQSDLRLRDAPPYTESANAPGVRRGRDERVSIYIPIHGSLYELQKKENEMSPKVETKDLPQRRMLSITRHVYIGELRDHLRQSYTRLDRIIAEAGVARAGGPVAIYHGHVGEESNGPVEVGIPVETLPQVDGEAQAGQLRGGPAAYTRLTLREAALPRDLGPLRRGAQVDRRERPPDRGRPARGLPDASGGRRGGEGSAVHGDRLAVHVGAMKGRGRARPRFPLLSPPLALFRLRRAVLAQPCPQRNILLAGRERPLALTLHPSN